MDLLASMSKRNPRLIRAAAALHQRAEIPADCYVADLEMICRNARLVKQAADSAGLRVYFEAKEVGRAPAVCRALGEIGFDQAIAIDVEEAYAMHRNGIRVGHVGHLGQIPTGEVQRVVSELRPEVITVYSLAKAQQIAAAAAAAGREQKLLIRVNGADDVMQPEVFGGTREDEACELVAAIERLDGAAFGGLTTYPGMRFSLKTHSWVPTTNFATMVRVRDTVQRELNLSVGQLNPAGNNCAASLATMAVEGATHCEPGQAFVGGLVANGFVDQPEVPAIAYVSEVTHLWAGKPYFFANSMVANATIGVWNDVYYDSLGATVSRSGTDPLDGLARTRPQSFAASDPTAWIYGRLDLGRGVTADVGDTVVCGFRTQVYRSNGGRLAVVDGIQSGDPTLIELTDRNGVAVADRPRPLA
jgi:predicted amino acid racemase